MYTFVRNLKLEQEMLIQCLVDASGLFKFDHEQSRENTLLGFYHLTTKCFTTRNQSNVQDIFVIQHGSVH